jgi:glutamyl/glutaminyl-tRNA synthetase
MKGVQKSGAVFDEVKLRWINKEHIKKMPSEVIEKIITDKIISRYPQKIVHPKVVSLIAERLEVLSDVDSYLENGDFSYFFETPIVNVENLPWKTDSLENARKHLEKIKEILTEANYASEESLKDSLMPYADKEGKGNVLWPLRFALSGKEKSPDPFTLIFVLGKEETDVRIERVLKLI